MSIYPVRAKTWWVCRKDNSKEMNDDIKLERGIIKTALKTWLTCLRCGKRIKNWDKCYISHGFVYGFDDAYCNEKCYRGGKP